MDNKLDFIRLQQTTQREFKDCCVLVFTETWLNDNITDAIQLDGLALFRADRSAALTGKTRGGGVCVYINTEWCKNSVLVTSYCSPLVEFVIVRCRPFYLPREFHCAFLAAVCIPPARTPRRQSVNCMEPSANCRTSTPKELLNVTGDFNHADLRSVLPKFHQHVDNM